jgi:uncharacterized SAM-binding protein YcdF (DUF218 family)
VTSSGRGVIHYSPMETVKGLIEIVFSPLGIMVLLIGVGILLCFFKRHLYVGRRLLICGGLLFLIFLFSPIAEYLILGLEKNYQPLLSPPVSPTIERIVVLAGYGRENPGYPITSNVSEQTLCTMSEGLRLYRLIPGAKLLLSGGVVRQGDRSVAATMADFFRQMGVPTKDLIVEGNSLNTYENLLQVKKIVGSKPFILVALGCDLRRAVAVARKLNMNPIPAPTCLWALPHHSMDMNASEWIADFFTSFAHPSFSNLTRLQWAYHEYAGYVWYRLLGRI